MMFMIVEQDEGWYGNLLTGQGLHNLDAPQFPLLFTILFLPFMSGMRKLQTVLTNLYVYCREKER